jgi:hypothetical protein
LGINFGTTLHEKGKAPGGPLEPLSEVSWLSWKPVVPDLMQKAMQKTTQNIQKDPVKSSSWH